MTVTDADSDFLLIQTASPPLPPRLTSNSGPCAQPDSGFVLLRP